MAGERDRILLVRRVADGAWIEFEGGVRDGNNGDMVRDQRTAVPIHIECRERRFPGAGPFPGAVGQMAHGDRQGRLGGENLQGFYLAAPMPISI